MTLEAVDIAEAADAFLEDSPALALRDWEALQRKLRHEVSLPTGFDLPLRPLFVPRAHVVSLIDSSAPGQALPDVVMPTGVVGDGGVTLIEPPHGREWLLHAAFLEVMRAPWLRRLSAELAQPSPLDALSSFLAARRKRGPLGLLLAPGEREAVSTSHVRVQQLLWLLEARAQLELTEPDAVARFAGALTWSSGGDAPTLSVPVWPGKQRLDRRALPALASAEGARFAAAQLEKPEALDEYLFKPFADAYSELDADVAEGEGVYQRRVERPVVRVPFLFEKAVEWHECGVELSALALDGTCCAPFARLVAQTRRGPIDSLCTVVLVG